MATRCLRYGSLAFLVAQDTALVLLMRYSRSHATGEMYLASTAVCCMEVLKLCVCVGMLYAGEARGSISGLLNVFRREFLEKPSEVLRLAVPSFLYLLQNNLLYFALSNLRATPYKVTYNLKILTSALFSVTMLGQKLSKRKWLSLIALFVGVTVVQSDNHKSDSDAPHPETGLGYQTLGFLAVVAAAFTSGFCGVYQQKILQAGKTNMWVRNAQMGLTSVCLGVVSTIVKDRQAIQERGFFQGYSKLVWTVIVIQAVGGLNIAFILKYADNILKAFATSVSIVVVGLVSHAFFGFELSAPFFLGAAGVLYAIFLYGDLLKDFAAFKRCPAALGGPPATVREGADALPK